MAHMVVEHWEVFVGPGNGVDPSDAPPQTDHNNQDLPWLFTLFTIYGSDLTISPDILHAEDQGPNDPRDDDGDDDRSDAECCDTTTDSCIPQNYVKSIIYGNKSWVPNCGISSDNKELMVIALDCQRLWEFLTDPIIILSPEIVRIVDRTYYIIYKTTFWLHINANARWLGFK